MGSIVDLIRANQLNIMLLLCGACGVLVILLLNTRFLYRSRKWILILMELIALFLLWFDREAYIYAGDPGRMGFIMVRISNCMVFLLTSAVIFVFNLYLTDLLRHEGGISSPPRRLKFVRSISVLGLFLAIFSTYINLYYYFDEMNQYHRGKGFLIAYIIPVLGPIIQYTVIRQHRKKFSKLIYTSLVLYIFVPILCGILQIFTYGISIVNMSMVAVSISLYIFTYLDINATVEHAHEVEIQNMQGEQTKMRRLFDQTATAFVSAVEKKDDFAKGNSIKVAQYARKIAELAGKNEEDCEKVYYAALLHDVGMIGVPDSVIKNEEDPGKWDYEMMRRKPLIGDEILSNITEYPYLRQGAHYSHERYNGTGYPEGLKGTAIPEIARIIAVADAYVTMTTKKRYRGPRPQFVAREAFVKGSGEEFDPLYANIMLNIIDTGTKENTSDQTGMLETEISCGNYREQVSTGISVENDIKRISFDYISTADNDDLFSAPSIIIFDSYDANVYDDERSVRGYHYLEYGELWFDKHSIITAARNIEEKSLDDPGYNVNPIEGNRYEIIAGRYEDHLKLIMRSKEFSKEVIIALPNSTNAAYIGLTGENCRLTNILAEPTGKKIEADEIRRISQPVSYIDHLESDIKNVQVDRWRSAYTDGIEITGRLKICFHAMSLPGANLVWHCPYIVLFYSDDGHVNGPNYKEYQMIKINGEDDGDELPYQNRFTMKKEPEFPGWEKWKEVNRSGMECEVNVERKGNRIILKTKNLGINIENTTSGLEGSVYIAFTGDQVALTDIRKYQSLSSF